MVPQSVRVVLDTNTLLRGLIAESSVAARVLAAAEERRFVTLLSRQVLAEYRAVLTDPDLLSRFPSLSERRPGVTLARLRYQGDFVRQVVAHFDYPRDQRDAVFIELAIDGRATHIVSYDRDLLSLPSGRSDACKRFRRRLPRVNVMEPQEFLRRIQLD